GCNSKCLPVSGRLKFREEGLKGHQTDRENLFGPVDHSQLRRDLKLKLKAIIEEDSRRWNFNFECETPLPGRFQWEEIPGVCTAAFHQDPARPKDAAHGSGGDRPSDGEEGAGTDQENCSIITNKRKSPTEETLHRRKRALSKPAASLKDNARITGTGKRAKHPQHTLGGCSPLLSTPEADGHLGPFSTWVLV
uniref:Cyclin-dependent kinase inhibitor domain-containing protein n=1 Tax=Neolamprologus brichardi TaxID=32507 RepID=A0A3Q4HRM2_NEOBR